MTKTNETCSLALSAVRIIHILYMMRYKEMQHLLADGLCRLTFSQMFGEMCLVMITELIFNNILMLCAVLKAQRSCDVVCLCKSGQISFFPTENCSGTQT